MKISTNFKYKNLTLDEEERYKRHLTLKEIGLQGQLKLKNSSVICIGAGGLGSSVLLYLAAAGIGKIGIVDNDKVEKSNLQRKTRENTFRKSAVPIVMTQHRSSLLWEVRVDVLQVIERDINLHPRSFDAVSRPIRFGSM